VAWSRIVTDGTFESIAVGKVQSIETPFAKITIQDISQQRFDQRDHQWDHIASAETGFDVQSPVLWHFRSDSARHLRPFQAGRAARECLLSQVLAPNRQGR
jgi:hypothetical protein